MSDYDVAISRVRSDRHDPRRATRPVGRRVVVLERYTGYIILPRAACFDDEIVRTFQKFGLVGEISRGAEVQRRVRMGQRRRRNSC